jgi:hypothetical protein
LIFQWVSAQRPNVPFNIHPESKDKINNKRRTHGEEGYINKPGTNAGCGDAQSLANSGAYSKCLPFYKLPEPVHASKLKHSPKMYKH